MDSRRRSCVGDVVNLTRKPAVLTSAVCFEYLQADVHWREKGTDGPVSLGVHGQLRNCTKILRPETQRELLVQS